MRVGGSGIGRRHPGARNWPRLDSAGTGHHRRSRTHGLHRLLRSLRSGRRWTRQVRPQSRLSFSVEGATRRLRQHFLSCFKRNRTSGRSYVRDDRPRFSHACRRQRSRRTGSRSQHAGFRRGNLRHVRDGSSSEFVRRHRDSGLGRPTQSWSSLASAPR